MAKNTIPSAKAMARMDCTRIFVEAPGLRPTASEALAPINPTPMAAPSAASPTWTLPVIPSASIGNNIGCPFVWFSAFPASELGQAAEILHSMVGRFAPFLMRADQQRKHASQEHEHQSLNEPDQQLKKVERDRNEPTQPGHQSAHRFQHVFTGKNVAVESKAQG